MDTIGAPHPDRADPGGQDRVIRRVKDAVAEAGQDHQRQQAPVARCQPEPDGRRREEPQTQQEDAAGAEAVDQKACRGLREAGRDVEQRHQQPEVGIADPERLLEHGKQRRQYKLIEMAEEVRRADQADDLGIAPQPGRGLPHRPTPLVALDDPQAGR